MSITASKSRASRRKGQPAPPPGSYSGRVDGSNAMFAVTAEVVSAWWIVRGTGGVEMTYAMNAWDITDGRFVPHHGRDLDLAVMIRKATRVVLS